jgi:hypothetical protein
MPELFKYQVIRYSPNRLSEEFYNLAVLLYNPDGRLVDARFTPDFKRLRCHPLADLEFLDRLKDEFEAHQMEGEGFPAYVDELRQNLSQGLHLSEERAFLGGEAREEVERLTQTYLATPKRAEARPEEQRPGTRRWILGRMRETFRLYHVLERIQAEAPVGSFVSPRFSFHMDYAYRPNGRTHYLHAVSLHHDMNDAPRLCFVFDRIRSQTDAALTAVVHDDLPQDTRDLLESSSIRSCLVSRLDQLALDIRDELNP